MEVINVTEFYETAIFLVFPLLIAQRIILCCCHMSEKYSAQTFKNFESEFEFTNEYQFAPAQRTEDPKDPQLKDSMIDKSDEIPPQHEDSMEANPDNSKVAVMEMDLEGEKQFRKNTRRPSNDNRDSASNEENTKEIKSEKKEERALERIRDSEEIKSNNTEKSQESEETPKRKSEQKKESGEQNSAKDSSKIEDKGLEGAKHSTTGVKGEGAEATQKEGTPDISEQVTAIEWGRMKYCRRIDQTFNIYVPLIFSVIVLGILTNSVYIFSMCCFFGFSFASLLFNYSHLLERLDGDDSNESLLAKIGQLMSTIFILALFISYWIIDEYGGH